MVMSVRAAGFEHETPSGGATRIARGPVRQLLQMVDQLVRQPADLKEVKALVHQSLAQESRVHSLLKDKIR